MPAALARIDTAMDKTTSADQSAAGEKSPGLRRLVTVAVAGACLFGVLLGVREISSYDIGYHLAYGDQFLDTGEIADTNPYIYTLGQERPRDLRVAESGPGTLARQGPPQQPGLRGQLAPGCWYDRQGRYRFPNANWLTQVVMSAVNRCAGFNGLGVLQAALVAGVLALSVVTMRRLSVPWLLTGAGLILMAMAAHPRFTLRPELFGYALLAAQLALLAGSELKWPAAVWLILLELLFVNFHSYFLLGLGITGAFLVEKLLRLGWASIQRGAGGEAHKLLRRDAFRLGTVLVGQAAACFVNPWTWRLFALPIQTLFFMRRYGISGSAPGDQRHPWAHIGEFMNPFLSQGFAGGKATGAFYMLLGLSGLGLLAAACKRRWGWLLVLAGMTAVGMSMRRNTTPAAVVIVPLALAGLWQWTRGRWGTLPRKTASTVTACFAAACVLVSACLSLAVVTQRFYYSDRVPTRFGLGLSEVILPLGATGWINTHHPEGTLWTDYDSSSNVYYFTRPHRSVPVLTNTWAYPPAVMADVLECCQDKARFEKAAGDYGVEVVVVFVRDTTGPLVTALADDPAWTLVHLDAAYVVFLNTNGPNAELARQAAITPQSLARDLPGYKARLRAMDRVAAYPTYLGGLTLYHLGWRWDDAAIDVFREARDLDPGYHAAWDMLGAALAERGQRRLAHRDIRGKADLQEAVRYFQQALRLKGDSLEARAHLERAQRDLAAVGKGGF